MVPVMALLDRLKKERIVAPPGFNRWRVPPASIAIHLCIGSVYAWSMFNPALIREHGVVASAASDWGLDEVVWIFSVAIVCLGLAAAVAGRWLEKVGPRCVGVTAAILWGGGFLIGVVVSRRLEPRGALMRHDVLRRVATSATGSHVLCDLDLVGVRTLLPRDGVLTPLDVK